MFSHIYNTRFNPRQARFTPRLYATYDMHDSSVSVMIVSLLNTVSRGSLSRSIWKTQVTRILESFYNMPVSYVVQSFCRHVCLFISLFADVFDQSVSTRIFALSRVHFRRRHATRRNVLQHIYDCKRDKTMVKEHLFSCCSLRRARCHRPAV